MMIDGGVMYRLVDHMSSSGEIHQHVYLSHVDACPTAVIPSLAWATHGPSVEI